MVLIFIIILGPPGPPGLMEEQIAKNKLLAPNQGGVVNFYVQLN